MAELFEVKIPHSGSVENVEITDWVVRSLDATSAWLSPARRRA